MARQGRRSVATGTFHDLLKKPSAAYADFIRVTGENSYQPVRREIYQARGKGEPYYLSDKSIQVRTRTSIFVRIFRKLMSAGE